jgi:fibronectin-binding autotransporter adhesin
MFMRSTIYFCSVILVALLTVLSVPAQSTYTWNGGNTGTPPWLTPGNWLVGSNLSTSTTYPGVSDVSSAGHVNDVARFGGGSTYGTVGVDLDLAGTNGLRLGAIHVSGSSTVTIQNTSSTANIGDRVLRLNGAYNGNLAGLSTNTLLSAQAGDIVIQPGATAVNNSGLGLQLGITSGRFHAASGRTISISSVISEAAAGSGFTFSGGGTLNLTAANTYTGTTTIAGAGSTVNVSGANGRLGTGGVTIAAGGRLNLDNAGAANNARLANSQAVTLTGGTLSLSGNSSASLTQQFGTLTAGGGFSEVRVTTAGSSTTILQGASLARSDNGLIYVSSGTSATNRLAFTTAPSLTNDALPFVIVENGAVGSGTRFATYGTNGIAQVSTSSNPAFSTGGFGATNNTRVTGNFTGGATQTGNSTYAANTLQIETWDIAGGTLGGNNTINIGTGAILINSTSGSRSYVMGPGSGDFSNPTNNRGVTIGFGGQTATITLISSTDYYTTGGGREYILNATFNNIGSGGLVLSGVSGNIFRLNNTSNAYNNLTINGLAVGAFANDPDKPFAVNFNNNANLGSGSNGVTLNQGFLVLRNRRQDIADTAITVTVNRSLTLAGTDRQGLGVTAAGSVLNWDGVISGTGSFTKIGAGTLVLSNANTYAGSTNIESGTLRLSGGNDRLPVGTQLTLGRATNSGVLVLNGFNQELAGLTTSGTGTGNRVVGGATTQSILTVNLASGTQTYGGVLGGTGTNENNLGLVKSGAGTLVLTAANTYTGNTTIQAGELRAANTSGSATGTGTVTVAAGTLSGTGSVGPVNVQANGTIRGDSGSGTGTLTLTGNSTLAGTLATQLTVSGGSVTANSKLAVGSNVLNLVSTGGAFTITLLNDAGLTLNNPYTITLATSSEADRFHRNGSPWDSSGNAFVPGADYVVLSGSGGWTYTGLSLVVDSSNNLVLTFTPVPEPGLVVGIGAAGLGLVGLVRRRRHGATA